MEDEKGNCIGSCGGMISDGTLPIGSASGMAQYSFYAALSDFATPPGYYGMLRSEQNDHC